MAVEIALMESLENRQLLSVPFFIQKNLVSDTAATPAAHHDANLVNPWGLARTSTGPWWVANNGTGTSTAYMGDGSSIGYTVKIPGADGVAGHGKPTGIVANKTNGFVITKGASSMPAEYVFVGEDGVISGWNIGVDANNAISMATSTNGAIYKGVTMGVSGGNTFLYAADFHNGAIDVFSNTFAKSTAFAGKFTDTRLPAGYAPF
ncbi:MAG TPA: TIGR03118 family protein, partial [Tepidisphaeraceae bacterium]|nr:TIGR03118 family protein [Tepidisphaeraceae bacterium]